MARETHIHEFKVGDLVNVGRYDHTQSPFIGQVVLVEGNWIGVRFEGWRRGHNLSGILCFACKDSGRWFKKDNRNITVYSGMKLSNILLNVDREAEGEVDCIKINVLRKKCKCFNF